AHPFGSAALPFVAAPAASTGGHDDQVGPGSGRAGDNPVHRVTETHTDVGGDAAGNDLARPVVELFCRSVGARIMRLTLLGSRPVTPSGSEDVQKGDRGAHAVGEAGDGPLDTEAGPGKIKRD